MGPVATRIVIYLRSYVNCSKTGLNLSTSIIRERIPNLTGEQSDGITVFRIPTMTSLMLHRCRSGTINLQRCIYTTHANRALQGRDLSGESVRINDSAYSVYIVTTIMFNYADL
ncbi:hypothetical protein ANN_24997 [Periplaneta americana]|uniref:Uncharacterized protein n=1 Tax=Periplaneta americana TaxID=6978 RepID=A0ABQ8S046_PERAM|nr:hypothetical protein ANN_24997 [Periplaneta americana]